MVSPPFGTATLVESETIEGQIGEGCRGGESTSSSPDILDLLLN